MLLDLPTDFVKEHILPNLSVSDIVTLDTAFAGKRIRKRLHTLFRNLVVQDAFEIDKESFAWLSKRSMLVGYAIINDGVSDALLIAMAKKGIFENTRRFKMEENTSLTSRGLKAALKLFHSICYFYARDSAHVDKGVLSTLAANHLNLMAVDVRRCDGVADADVLALAQYSCDLEGLHAANCYGVTDVSIVSLTGNCPRLRELVLANCGGISGASLAAMARNIPDLAHLNLENNVYITDDDVAVFLQQENASLLTLELRGCSGITDGGLITIVQRCPSLTHLDVQGCKVTARVVETIISEGSEYLTTFCVLGVAGLTDAIMTKFCKRYPYMQHLRVGACAALTDQTLAAIAQNMPELTEFAVFGNAHYSDAGVTQLAQSCPQLTHVEIDSCKGLTDTAVEAIAQHGPNLTLLSVYRNTNMGDRSVLALAAHSSALDTLNIVNLTVTEAALTKLVSSCPMLSYLQLDAFEEMPPALQELCDENSIEILLGDLAAGIFADED